MALVRFIGWLIELGMLGHLAERQVGIITPTPVHRASQ
jgi:hypothetical protein